MIIQGTDEWLKVRLGKATASRIPDIMATVRSGEAAGRRNYRAQLVCERLTGEVEESYSNAAMKRGTELEPFAREAYEFKTGNTVDQIGFADHPRIAMSGASPDGLVGTCGLVEIKCPNSATHIQYLLDGDIPSQYIPQMQWQMACTDRSWCDFVSYDPRLGVDLQLFIIRVPRDDKLIAEMERAVIKFIAEVELTVQELKELVL